jgi:hypothetical protein
MDGRSEKKMGKGQKPGELGIEGEKKVEEGWEKGRIKKREQADWKC